MRTAAPQPIRRAVRLPNVRPAVRQAEAPEEAYGVRTLRDPGHTNRTQRSALQRHEAFLHPLSESIWVPFRPLAARRVSKSVPMCPRV